jgi:hypothetical protein
MTPLWINFHTRDPGYSAEARGLIESLQAHGLEYDVNSVEPFDSWVHACSHKAAYVQDRRKKHPARPLIWVDADARVLQYPHRLMNMPPEIDFAAHWLAKRELLAGTLYFAPTLTANQVIDSWADICSRSKLEWDQRVLQRVVRRARGLRIDNLPPTYTWIAGENFDWDADISGQLYGPQPPVIRHRQASRRLKIA